LGRKVEKMVREVDGEYSLREWWRRWLERLKERIVGEDSGEDGWRG